MCYLCANKGSHQDRCPPPFAKRVGMTVPMFSASEAVVSRRHFLISSVSAAGGFILSWHVTSRVDAQEVTSAKSRIYPSDAFVRIQADGKIVIQVNRLEFGQGVATALPLL